MARHGFDLVILRVLVFSNAEAMDRYKSPKAKLPPIKEVASIVPRIDRTKQYRGAFRCDPG
jgi:hypothetical protein